MSRILVAGVGNIFLRDDGFGPEVVRRVAEDVAGLPGWEPAKVRVEDYGIRGLHLAYDLLDGVDALVLVDALPARQGGSGHAGSVQVMRIRSEDLDAGGSLARAGLGVSLAFDPHGMDPLAVLNRLRTLGGTLPLTFLVGCVAARTDEGIGLSEEVAGAVPAAAEAVRTLVTTRIPAASGRTAGDPDAGEPQSASAEPASAQPDQAS